MHRVSTVADSCFHPAILARAQYIIFYINEMKNIHLTKTQAKVSGNAKQQVHFFSILPASFVRECIFNA
jgi:hypothetical protein